MAKASPGSWVTSKPPAPQTKNGASSLRRRKRTSHQDWKKVRRATQLAALVPKRALRPDTSSGHRKADGDTAVAGHPNQEAQPAMPRDCHLADTQTKASITPDGRWGTRRILKDHAHTTPLKMTNDHDLPPNGSEDEPSTPGVQNRHQPQRRCLATSRGAEETHQSLLKLKINAAQCPAVRGVASDATRRTEQRRLKPFKRNAMISVHSAFQR